MAQTTASFAVHGDDLQVRTCGNYHQSYMSYESNLTFKETTINRLKNEFVLPSIACDHHERAIFDPKKELYSEITSASCHSIFFRLIVAFLLLRRAYRSHKARHGMKPKIPVLSFLPISSQRNTHKTSSSSLCLLMMPITHKNG